MEITQRELGFLNFYRSSELHGGLILGQIARGTRDGALLIELTRHSVEEVQHSLLWTETIVAVGGRIVPVRETYQDRYASVIGVPTGLLDVLALTQVFERRVYRHFTDHLRRRGTHPRVRVTLARMLEEEKGHLTWVKRWLDQQALIRGDVVRETMQRYVQADAIVYEQMTAELGWAEAA